MPWFAATAVNIALDLDYRKDIEAANDLHAQLQVEKDLKRSGLTDKEIDDCKITITPTSKSDDSPSATVPDVKPKKKWFARLPKDVVVGGGVGAIEAIPIAGPILGGIIQEVRSSYAARKAAEALEGVRAELIERMDKQDAETAAKVEAYVNGEEFINAVLFPTLEATVRAQGQAKVDAAKNFAVNSAMAAGGDDPALREFVAAFLRDATVLDIRALLKLPRSGERVDPRKIDINVLTLHLDNFFNQLSLALRLSGPAEDGLLQGALGRLSMLGLCVTQTGSNNRICPVQRTQLGDEVVNIIS